MAIKWTLGLASSIENKVIEFIDNTVNLANNELVRILNRIDFLENKEGPERKQEVDFKIKRDYPKNWLDLFKY